METELYNHNAETPKTVDIALINEVNLLTKNRKKLNPNDTSTAPFGNYLLADTNQDIEDLLRLVGFNAETEPYLWETMPYPRIVSRENVTGYILELCRIKNAHPDKFITSVDAMNLAYLYDVHIEKLQGRADFHYINNPLWTYENKTLTPNEKIISLLNAVMMLNDNTIISEENMVYIASKRAQVNHEQYALMLLMAVQHFNLETDWETFSKMDDNYLEHALGTNKLEGPILPEPWDSWYNKQE